ncbi:glycohydrolase toxin TNT-related protein [Epilithonimonas zeae]|uniref:glycohydrolase toxin TNT-related protein n=1 Tax=Epilithonimonas zeae TaxID=1416779 RepID=UPI00293EF7E7|nr:glycohydrolase toxin TNT-related protein [Epilithonimonas zeae]
MYKEKKFIKNIYQYKDHLGNVRLSYARNTAIGAAEYLNGNNYYPFGLNFINSGDAAAVYNPSANYANYKYNQKELQETGFYDYGWRQYMPDLGRWFGMDQLSETYHSASPYAYVLNNPIMMYDPDGRKVNPTKDGWEFTGDDISSVYDYLNGGGNVGMLTHALSAWGDMRTGQDFWSYFSSWNGSGNGGRVGSIYTTTASDGPVTGNAHDIQGIIFTKTKIAQTFSDTEIIQNTQASWRTGGGVVMMDSVFDVLGIALANAQPKNKNLAILLGGLAIGVSKGRAVPSVLKAEMAVEKAEVKTLAHYYPADGGALGDWTTKTLEVGTKIDRYGSSFGKYFSEYGTPMEMRALPPGNTGMYNAFEVIKPFSVQSSNIAPAFGQIGTGVQYYGNVPKLVMSMISNFNLLKIK